MPIAHAGLTPAKNALLESEDRFRLLVESVSDLGIFLLDCDGYIISWNAGAQRIKGYSAEEVIGRHMSMFYPPEDLAAGKPAMELRLASERGRWEDEGWRLRADGTRFWANVLITAMRGSSGNLRGFSKQTRDFTDRKAFERELHNVKTAAEAANRAKSDFLANMSHELRTPMTAIIGFAEMMLRPGQDPTGRVECVQTILSNARHLLELLNTILDLSKIEAGEMTVESIDCNLPELMAGVLSTMRQRAVDAGLSLEMTFQDPIPRQVLTDPLRLRQILLNLIGNAIKFTSSGRVGVHVQLEGTAPEPMLRLDVTDTGIGMTPAQLHRLFRPFSQADESTTRRFGGTGLGLMISRQLAQLLGGDISVQSQPDVGSTFTTRIGVMLPQGVEMIAGLTESSLPKLAAPTFSTDVSLRGRILLAEDGRDNMRLLSTHLRAAGAEVEIAENGQMAVDLATAQLFDLILMDMQMPLMDGYTAAAELRRRGCVLPIIALTASAMADDRDKCLASGCSGYLTKPISREMLLNEIGQYLGQIPPGSIQQPSASPVSPRRSMDQTIVSSVIDYPGMAKIVTEFVESLPDEIAKINHLLDEHDLQSLRRVVHQLRGSGGGYGFDPISDLAADAEVAINAVEDVEAIKMKIESLTDVIQRVEGFDASRLASNYRLPGPGPSMPMAA